MGCRSRCVEDKTGGECNIIASFCGTITCNIHMYLDFIPQTLVTPRYYFGFTSAPKAVVCP